MGKAVRNVKGGQGRASVRAWHLPFRLDNVCNLQLPTKVHLCEGVCVPVVGDGACLACVTHIGITKSMSQHRNKNHLHTCLYTQAYKPTHTHVREQRTLPQPLSSLVQGAILTVTLASIFCSCPVSHHACCCMCKFLILQQNAPLPLCLSHAHTKTIKPSWSEGWAWRDVHTASGRQAQLPACRLLSASLASI